MRLPNFVPLLIGMEGAKTPAGSAGQARPRRRFGAEEARRPPRGKRSVLERKATAPIHEQNKKAADKLQFSLSLSTA
ncbi:Ribose 5-phosphate isomerase B [Bacillus badius]|nr:Ribose 5-phosphate isomerase B [Bacillus badius]